MHNCDMKRLVANFVRLFPVVTTVAGVKFKCEVEVMAEAVETAEGDGWELTIEGYQILSVSRWESSTLWEVLPDTFLDQWQELLFPALDEELENDYVTRGWILEKVIWDN